MKKVMVIIMIIFSLFAFGFNLDISKNNISISKNIWEVGDNSNIGVWLSYPVDFSDFNLPGIGINYNDKNEFFTYQKVFFKKIKLKAGERYFGLNVGYDFNNDSIVLATEVKKYKNDLISKSFSYSYTSVFKGGSEERKISLDRFLVPTVAKASIFSISYDNLGSGNNVSNYGIQLQRYFTIPFVIGSSDLGYSLSIPIGVIDDKYISGYFAYGVLYDGEYSPEFSFQTPFKVNKKDYYMGMQLKMNSNAKFIAYLTKVNIDNPFTIIITNNGGSFFFEY
ncbi:hypothetical protein [Marinitoga aeolica]|uniref:Uncharacterized protein n=1 Tax=Marinitoga aeolica TaxID=2809031 RepID=A0ABY8PMQ1_9BACT|nr:hypothetical protein [Marinitoga aeolica]WGS63913.1 hypothetical protein JRV97_05905 [Marinitoga aeolica]